MNIKMMEIEKLDNQGRGITYYNNKIMFVNGALDNEEVEVKDIVEKKKNYEANVLNIIEKNKNRIVPKCPYYELCGGCNLMHLVNNEELKFKQDKVASILNKYANIGVSVKVVESDKDLFYRNKITLVIEDYKWGYFNKSSHIMKEIDKCLLANKKINDVLNNKKLFNIKNGTITIRTNYEGKILLIINTKDDYKIDFDNMLKNVVGIVVNDKVVYKDNFFYDYIGEYKFKVSYNSFFQINNYVASRIFDILKNNISGKNLLDLYCGVGTLGIALKDNFKNIYGIEKIKNAIVDAKYNAKINNINNAFYYAGDTYKILKNINQKFDSIIVDPPRSGLNKDTLDLIMSLESKYIAYVSCDPMTLARDLKTLTNKYAVLKVYALDMFPNTYHVETICIMKKL